ncbi:THO complex subunit 3-like [Artemia franciscana]|uniref:THO complex subunit 3 n=1 Tax=Artemia franciscana TaxID=6661 RepID=A0AA88L0X1_ARTSF|nr:hypothetical protein QYM36_013079 [Artemia franciscana]
MPESLQDLQNHFKRNSKVRDFPTHKSKVHSVDWNSDGRRLASGSFDQTICIYSLSGDRLEKPAFCKGHFNTVDQIKWHATNPDLLSSASADKTVRVWDARLNRDVAKVSTKGENINISWSPDGTTIAVGNKEDLVTFIDTRNFKIRTEMQYKFEVNEIAWNKANDLFFMTSGQGHIHVLNYPELTTVYTINAHPGNCICIEFDPSGQLFAVGSADAIVSLWDLSELACLRTFSRLEWPVRTISFSHDSRLLASASEDLEIDISDVESGENVSSVKIGQPCFTVAWHPKRYLLAFACDDPGNVQLYGIPD